jgi:hypothetical protein
MYLITRSASLCNYPGTKVGHVGRLSGEPSYVRIFLAGVIEAIRKPEKTSLFS